MKIAVCDDEIREAEKIKSMVAEYFTEKNITTEIIAFFKGEELIKSKNTFQLVFLDIEMAGMNGIETGRQIRIRDVRVPIVYVTSHRDYYAKAYQVHAFGYLKKPVKKEEMWELLDDFRKLFEEEKKLLLNTEEKGMMAFLDDDILMFEIKKKKEVLIKTTIGSYVIRDTLEDIYSKLDHKKFYRSHRGCIVNLVNVKCVKDYDILLEGGEWAPLAQRKKEEFLQRMNKVYTGESEDEKR